MNKKPNPAKSLRQLFAAVDGNNTGFMTKIGFRNLMQRELESGHDDLTLDVLFERLDRDNDDAIRYSDFETAITGYDRAKRVSDLLNQVNTGIDVNHLNIDTVLRMFDINGDGTLSRGESRQSTGSIGHRFSTTVVNFGRVVRPNKVDYLNTRSYLQFGM